MDLRFPQRLFKNVPGQDRAASGGRQAAGEGILSDNKPLHLLQVGFGHVSRASDRVQAGEVRVGDIEGDPRLASRLLSDNAGENAKRIFQRRAMDRRLERFFLPAHPLLISPQRLLGPGALDRLPGALADLGDERHVAFRPGARTALVNEDGRDKTLFLDQRASEHRAHSDARPGALVHSPRDPRVGQGIVYRGGPPLPERAREELPNSSIRYSPATDDVPGLVRSRATAMIPSSPLRPPWATRSTPRCSPRSRLAFSWTATGSASGLSASESSSKNACRSSLSPAGQPPGLTPFPQAPWVPG